MVEYRKALNRYEIHNEKFISIERKGGWKCLAVELQLSLEVRQE